MLHKNRKFAPAIEFFVEEYMDSMEQVSNLDVDKLDREIHNAIKMASAPQDSESASFETKGN